MPKANSELEIQRDVPYNEPHPPQKVGASETPPPAPCVGYGYRNNSIVMFVMVWTNIVIPQGGILSNSFNLASATLGAGIISLPWAFNAVGLVAGTIYLVLMTIVTVYTITIIALVMEKTGHRAYEQMSRGVLGMRAAHFMAFVMGLSSLGTAVAYIIAIYSIVTPVLVHSPGTSEYFKTHGGARVVTFLVWLLGMLPLVVPKKVNTLRYISAMGVAFVVYFAVVIIIHAARGGLPKRSEVKMYEGGNIALEGFGIFIFAYLCQSIAFQVYFEMRIRSVKKIAIAATISMSFCTLVYWVAGVFGYMDFGVDVRDSVLYMYNPVQNSMVMVAYIGLVLKICVSYSLNMIPLRNTAYFLLKWDIDELPYWKHAAIVTGISGFALVSGLFIPKISTVFNVAGPVCGGFIGFIYPALFYMYSGNWSLSTVGWFHYLLTYTTLIAGVASVIFGTAGVIHSMVV